MASNLSFSDALVALKQGQKLSRDNWNAPNQYIVLQKGYPDGIAINKNTSEAIGVPEGEVRRFLPYFMICTAQGDFVPWLVSQTDLLADDWRIIV